QRRVAISAAASTSRTPPSSSISSTGEHGVGSDKRCYMEWMFSADDLATMQLERQAFDPAGLANPAKIFPTPASCAESARRKAVLPQAAGLEVF
ncbi:MAG: FAD-linked oxidase C-terminal domain-containing protein, partial [Vulcanococcus sp.]